TAPGRSADRSTWRWTRARSWPTSSASSCRRTDRATDGHRPVDRSRARVYARGMELSRETALAMYERMALIRAFEERGAKLFAHGRIPGFVHLYAGEEAVAVGVCSHLNDGDYITSTHRGHGHCIAKGVPVSEMMAELFGRSGGSCKGKGGSMHIADVSRGMLGANGIVGGGPPLAAGAAPTAKVLGTGAGTGCLFGERAAEQGTTPEAVDRAPL